MEKIEKSLREKWKICSSPKLKMKDLDQIMYLEYHIEDMEGMRFSIIVAWENPPFLAFLWSRYCVELKFDVEYLIFPT